MGHDPDREPPVFFTKAADAIAPGHGDVAYPPATADLHPELEMVVALAKGGRDIDVSGALGCVFGYGVGIDMTRRDMQAEAKQLRRRSEERRVGPECVRKCRSRWAQLH